MEATDALLASFVEFHERYLKAHQRIVILQDAAIEGIKHIGVGCVNEESKAEFCRLKQEIEDCLSGMKAICDKLH